MTPVLIAIIIIIILILVFIIVTYNSLVTSRNKVKDQWSQIDVVLKQRNDLIPNIVETVKGYTKHEKETLESVITARSKCLNAKTTESKIESSFNMTKALGNLIALSEKYPDLKANENFIKLQDSLNEIEEKIRYSRQFYNDSVLLYKNKIETFPSVIVAKLFGFKPESFFEATSEERKNVNVKF